MAATQTGRMSEQEYRELALGDRAMHTELVRGQLREKPPMTVAHGRVMMTLAEQLLLQLDRAESVVRIQHARLRVSSETYFIPDVTAIPAALERA